MPSPEKWIVLNKLIQLTQLLPKKNLDKKYKKFQINFLQFNRKPHKISNIFPNVWFLFYILCMHTHIQKHTYTKYNQFSCYIIWKKKFGAKKFKFPHQQDTTCTYTHSHTNTQKRYHNHTFCRCVGRRFLHIKIDIPMHETEENYCIKLLKKCSSSSSSRHTQKK